MEWIEVLYSCDGCEISDVRVKVPARTTEDVSVWVGQIMAACISQDHSRRSPWCQARTMRDVKIPIEGASKVGGPLEN